MRKKKKAARGKKASPKLKKSVAKNSRAAKTVRRSKKSSQKRAPRLKGSPRRTKVARGADRSATLSSVEPKGVGSEAGGQSGDIQGLSGTAQVDSESVEELAEEGQAFEAGIIGGVENAPDADSSEVTTEEVPEDDVPGEYQERD